MTQLVRTGYLLNTSSQRVLFNNASPAGYGFLRVGSPGASQLVRVGFSSTAPRILIPRPPAGYAYLRIGSPGASQLVRVGVDGVAPRILILTGV